MGCPGYPWISLRFQLFRIRQHISPNPATYFDILLNNSRLESRCTTSWISQGFKGDAATDSNYSKNSSISLLKKTLLFHVENFDIFCFPTPCALQLGKNADPCSQPAHESSCCRQHPLLTKYFLHHSGNKKFWVEVGDTEHLQT